MEKFSVKKPFTVLVGVVMVLLLGFVALSHMQTNLLPDISTPYLMVVTVYPGASPERVESEVSDVMENALGTVAGVDTITATSAENYSLLLMKFSEGTDMNSTMVKVSNKVDQTVSSLPSSCLTPSIIEYSMNMNAFMTVAISREGSDVYDLSDFVSSTLVPYVERKGGVSSVSANGLIEKMVQVQLSQSKIDVINEKLLETIDVQLAAAHEQLEAAQAQIEAGRKEYEKQLKNYGDMVSDTVMAQMGTEVGAAVTTVRDKAQALLDSVNQLIAVVNEPEIQQALIEVRDGLQHVVDQFNETTGREKGIRVESASQGSVSDLETNVMDAAQGKVGAAAMPNIFSAYADTAYALDQMGMLVDLSQYLTEDERAQYVQGYLDEGDFDGDGSMKIFPVAKSTELMFLNETDWEKFAQATGAAYDDLSTVEGLVATAGAYYDWTDAQTPEPDDGKALFGRDAMANYMLVGARQLGDTLFEVQGGKMTLNFDKDVARKLWDNYYVPFVKGWFAATGRFRSDDIKVGNVLAYVGSNSSATFFPAQVMVNDTESYDIDMTVLPSPKFAGGEDVAVQQGAGMVVTAGTEEEINASVEFLKWFTQPEHNISFSVDSGYLPVTTAANDMEAIKTSGLELSPKMERILSNAVQSVKNNTLYTPSAFAGGSKARKVLEYSLSDLASADRATVQERVAAGQPAADAEAEFLTDEYFDAWYGGICTALEEYAG